MFDDLEDELVKNMDMFRQLWTVLSHHLNTTPIAVLHNLYAKNIRTVSINTHRFVLTRSLRDSSQISFLSRQSLDMIDYIIIWESGHMAKMWFIILFYYIKFIRRGPKQIRKLNKFLKNL